MKKVLVTGGSGFIGTAVIKKLLEEGFEVRSYDLIKSDVKGAESYIGSIMDESCIANALKGCNYVIHLAAMLGVRRTEIKRMECLDINILGTKNVLEACVKERIKKVLISSSSEVYGDIKKSQLLEDDPKNPKSAYAVTKLVCEEYLQAYKLDYDLDYSIVRFFNVYGPNQVAEFVMPKFIKMVQEGIAPSVYGDGGQVRAFCYVEDAVEGVFRALTMDKANGMTFNIGNDTEPITMLDLAKRVIKVAKKDMTPKIIPFEKSDRDEKREIFKRMPSIERAKKVLNYSPKVSLDEGIKKTLEGGGIRETWFEPFNKSN